MIDQLINSDCTPPQWLLQGASLFLDFDGTLVEIADTPDSIQVDERLTELLSRLQDRLAGRLALISGRPAAEVHSLLGTHFAVVGSHGLEFATPGAEPVSAPRSASLLDALEMMRTLAVRHPGVIVEDKPLGVALHFRQCPGAERDCTEMATRLATTHSLHLQHGKMMVEVRVGGGDKGTAIATLMREPHNVGTRPIFMGDDITDEAGFEMVAQLGGAGILVGPKRATAARYRLDGVGSSLAWLEAASAEAA